MRHSLVVLALAGALVAGCGDDTEKKYVQGVNAAQEEFGKRIATSVEGPTSETRFNDQSAAAKDLATNLAALKPPKNLTDQNHELAVVARDIAKRLDQAANGEVSGLADDIAFDQKRVHTIIGSINVGLEG